ncbi:MAG TPA: hypothetical protein VGD43_07785 [Micromonospora sp.]
MMAGVAACAGVAKVSIDPIEMASAATTLITRFFKGAPWALNSSADEMVDLSTAFISIRVGQNGDGGCQVGDKYGWLAGVG